MSIVNLTVDQTIVWLWLANLVGIWRPRLGFAMSSLIIWIAIVPWLKP